MDEQLEAIAYQQAIYGLIQQGLIEEQVTHDGEVRYSLTHKGYQASAPAEVRVTYGWE